MSLLPALTLKSAMKAKAGMSSKRNGAVSPSNKEIAASHESFVGNGITLTARCIRGSWRSRTFKKPSTMRPSAAS